tara:strand:+ start:99 stop:497 length:399 start_codon:yes stop_codon:yes gene_type:complete
LAGRGYLFGVMKKWATLLSGIAAGFLFAGCGGGEEAATTSAATDPTVVAYPLEICLVGDSKLGSMGKPHTFVHEGREIKFCCEGCNAISRLTPPSISRNLTMPSRRKKPPRPSLLTMPATPRKPDKSFGQAE